MKLYEYVVFFNPKNTDKKKHEEAKILVGPKTVLTNDEKTAMLIAGREIPESFLNRLDQVEVAVRSF